MRRWWLRALIVLLLVSVGLNVAYWKKRAMTTDQLVEAYTDQITMAYRSMSERVTKTDPAEREDRIVDTFSYLHSAYEIGVLMANWDPQFSMNSGAEGYLRVPYELRTMMYQAAQSTTKDADFKQMTQVMEVYSKHITPVEVHDPERLQEAYNAIHAELAAQGLPKGNIKLPSQ